MRRSILFAILSLSLSACSTAFGQSVIDVTHYKAELYFDLTAQNLEGQAEISFRNVSGSPLTEVSLDLRDLTVTNVEVGAAQTSFSHADGRLTVTLPSPLADMDSAIVRVDYNGKATSEAGASSWGGCFWGSTTFSMGVGFNAPYVSMTRHWLPSNDIPSDKSTFDLAYTVPSGFAAAGTGVLTDVTTVTRGTRYHWVEGHPTATYLVTYAISNFALINQAWNSIPIQYFVPQADSVLAYNYFSTVPEMLVAFTNAFGPYPFDKVGYCITPIGAMEHQTMISYPTSMYGKGTAGTVAAHELAHQWWGDWVSVQDFKEAWLSEGFATFSEAIYAEHLGGRTRYYQTAHQFISTYRNQVEYYEGLFPLYDFPRMPPSSNYPQTIYDKGGAVLVMLRHIMGTEAFFNGLRTYGLKYGYGNATTASFQAEMETEYGKSLSWFFDQWVFKAGYPNYTIQKIDDNSSQPFRLRILQVQDTLKIPLFRMPIDVWLYLKSGDTLRFTIENQAVAAEEFSFQSVPANSVQSYSVDPLGVILKNIRYSTVSIEQEKRSQPEGFLLERPFPNPVFRSELSHMTIPATVQVPVQVNLEMFDSLGRSIQEIYSGRLDPGRHIFHPGEKILSPGVYSIHLRSGNSGTVQQFIILD